MNYKGNILSLTKILAKNLIRVVQKSGIQYYRKHGIILCKSHPLLKLIILDKHNPISTLGEIKR